MADFHFLRPWWLALLPVGVWLIWQLLRGRADVGGWRSIVDPALRGYVLAEPQVLREGRWPLVGALGAWALACLALAGPTWERLPVPAFRSEEALVVALDLSHSMDAGDVEPTRLARAKLKLLDLLNRRTAGQTALVVFTTHAFTVTPLTTDTRTISALVGAVSTQIMPTQGSSLKAGLDKSEALLRQAGLNRGDVLLITDAEVGSADLDAARDLRSAGFRVSVLAVGTEQGAPIGQQGGGFLTDEHGEVVIPRLDPSALQRLAAAGGGRFARLAPDDRDLDAVLAAPAVTPAALDTRDEQRYQADVWRDRGALLAAALLPFLALVFRRGWLCVLTLWLVLPIPRAEAFEWQDIWQRRDQRGYEALQQQQPDRAAKLFEDPAWRGAAEYRAGDFADSAATLAALDTADGHYNRGNALAKAGKAEEAIREYDRALELDPQHADARYNRDLLKDYLEKNKKEQSQQQQQNQQNGQRGDKKDGSDDASGDKQASDPQQGGDSEGDQSRDDRNDGQKKSSESNENEDPSQADGSRSSQAQDGQRPDDKQNQKERKPGKQALSAEDVEKWASEQAADQWLRRIPQDPGGLLRRKFLYQYQRFGVDQDGKSVTSDGRESHPW